MSFSGASDLSSKYGLADLCLLVAAAAVVFALTRLHVVLGLAAGGVMVGAATGRFVSGVPAGWYFGAVRSALVGFICFFVAALVFSQILGHSVLGAVSVLVVTGAGFIVGGYRGGKAARAPKDGHRTRPIRFDGIERITEERIL